MCAEYFRSMKKKTAIHLSEDYGHGRLKEVFELWSV
jgi:hypothetical protein